MSISTFDRGSVSLLPIFLLIESAVITCTIFSIIINNVVHVHSTLTKINTIQVWSKGGDKAGKYGYQMTIKKKTKFLFTVDDNHESPVTTV